MNPRAQSLAWRRSKNKLQDEKKRTLINADEALKVSLVARGRSAFEMSKLVSGHLK